MRFDPPIRSVRGNSSAFGFANGVCFTLLLASWGCDSSLVATLGGAAADDRTVSAGDIVAHRRVVSGFDGETVMLYQFADGARWEAVGAIDDANEVIAVDTWVLHVGETTMTVSEFDESGRPTEAIVQDAETGNSARVTFEWSDGPTVSVAVYSPMDAEEPTAAFETEVDEGMLADAATTLRASTRDGTVITASEQVVEGSERRLDFRLRVCNQFGDMQFSGSAYIQIRFAGKFVTRLQLTNMGTGVWSGSLPTEAPTPNEQLKRRCRYVVTGPTLLAVIPTVIALASNPASQAMGWLAAALGGPGILDALYELGTDLWCDNPQSVCDVLVSYFGK